MPKQIIVSGIQPTGPLHIGNYLGALKNFIEFQNDKNIDSFFFIADLHSLTIDFTPEEKKSHIVDIAASYLAIGLEPKKSTLFIQSHVPAHTELSWILSTITPMGELERMTQFKDKSERGSTNAGLFTYPILMAADILLYNATLVPVGDDQDQHLELARTIARRFNSRFGEIMVEPKAQHTSTPRLMSLDNPMKKMSKSLPGGCLFMDDSPQVIEKKIMTAVTDSGKGVEYNPELKPGISNLLLIKSALTQIPIEELVKEFSGSSYAEFKKSVAQSVVEHMSQFREKKLKLMKNPKKIMNIFESGAQKASRVASAKLKEVKIKIGLL